MIARVWRWWTSPRDADTYEAMLRTEALPSMHRLAGFRGAYLLRRDEVDEVAFVTLTLFENVGAVRAFAGEDYTRAVIHAPARSILTRFDGHALHYETIMTPETVRAAAETLPASVVTLRRADDAILNERTERAR